MNKNNKNKDKIYYGIDAPDYLISYSILSIIGIGMGLGFQFGVSKIWISSMGISIIISVSYCFGITFGVTVIMMLMSTLFFKYLTRRKLFMMLNLYGNENIIDIGCGRGFLIIELAKKLTTGKCYGIDIFDSWGQSSNSIENTKHNANLANVTDKVEIEYGNVCEIPYPDNIFDIAVSSFVLHRVKRHMSKKNTKTRRYCRYNKCFLCW